MAVRAGVDFYSLRILHGPLLSLDVNACPYTSISLSCLCVRDVCSCRTLGRLVNVYMNQYFCPAAIEEPNFLLSELKEYYVPPDGDLQSYKASSLSSRAVPTNHRLG